MTKLDIQSTFAEWYRSLTSMGDPLLRPNLLQEAFTAGAFRAVTMPQSQYAWLIEARWQPPSYIGIRKVGRNELYWTPDHSKALRFARKIDAEALLELMGDIDYPSHRALITGPGPMPIAVEHAWDAP